MDLELQGSLSLIYYNPLGALNNGGMQTIFARTNLDPPCLSMNEHVLAIEKQFC